MTAMHGIRAGLLRRQAKRRRQECPDGKRGCSLEAANSIGLLLDGRVPGFAEFARDFADRLTQEGRDVHVLAYLPRLSKKAPCPVPCFTRSDLNWYARPVRGEALAFMYRPFDLLINLSPGAVPPLEYLCATSPARFVVGNGALYPEPYYDCLIKVNDARDPARFMENLRQYLTLQA